MAVHQCEKWQLRESAKGGMYCAACGMRQGDTMSNKPQKFTHAVANLNGKEYVIPMELSDKAVRKALHRIIGEAELAKRTVHERVALADRVMQIAAEELAEELSD